jgi:SAM-dependent methyltransferase
VIVNEDQANAWDGTEGETWAADQDRYDAGVGVYNEHLLDAANISTNERVLDIGCGCGQSTRSAARLAASGSAVGVDLSSQMLARARDRAREEGVENVTFEQADAQVHPFAPGEFDVAISRFGAMFFGDPVAAFRNIGSGLRADARIALVAWQPLAENEWLSAIRATLAMGRQLPEPPIGMPGPFGLADPDAVRSILDGAGYVDIGVEGIQEPFYAGADADDAFDFVGRIGPVRGLLEDLDEAAEAQALEQLRAAIAEHETADGVLFGSSAWLVTARRA